jgi:hypothetical protein
MENQQQKMFEFQVVCGPFRKNFPVHMMRAAQQRIPLLSKSFDGRFDISKTKMDRI